ncbi:MAG: hypothetical protein QW328_08790 [Nitrososphaerota archaeon]
MEEKYKSRKFILALVLIAVVIVLKWFEKLDNNNFANLLVAFFAVYCGSNVASKFTQNHQKTDEREKEREKEKREE